GGSATTDGGLGAVQAITKHKMLRDVDFVVACDVRTMFVDAAETFAPQKGATDQQVRFLTARLEGAADHYLARFGVDVRALSGSGAAGGLAGGLAALGARLVPGFDLVANEVGFAAALADCDLVITGEGRLDATSFAGKVVGEVVQSAGADEKPVVVICGEIDSDAHSTMERLGVSHMGLRERFGDLAVSRTTECIARSVALHMRDQPDQR
ncbi:MAG: hypothetical protein EBV17_00005, partial [Actinobacteria bacterium]|nr:hypothetical protein [Actinomycetota bacterium]NCV09037.1 hypothetical protein [Actinomycetota bacterium]NCW90515.1 hypothetical protein [Acidimicrobiia bacterium]